jgi:hypothetical protein
MIVNVVLDVLPRITWQLKLSADTIDVEALKIKMTWEGEKEHYLLFTSLVTVTTTQGSMPGDRTSNPLDGVSISMSSRWKELGLGLEA